MDDTDPSFLLSVWRQNSVCVILRKGPGYKVLVKLPISTLNPEIKQKMRAFLQKAKPSGYQPQWVEKYQCWEISQSWFNDVVDIILRRYRKTYVIQPYRVQEKCASKCMQAVGHECQCSCMGANHGMGGPNGGWFEISETFATRWHDAHLACRLMTARSTT